MGHLASKQAYGKLRKKLDSMPVGAPGETTIYQILELLYTPEEAAIGAQMPLKLSSLAAISRKTKIGETELKQRLEKMANKGIVLDLHIGDKVRYMLTPTIVGFFEFSMMRVRDDVDQKELAHLLHKYMLEDGEFAGQFDPASRVSPFRTLVHEQTIPEDYTEVLSYERVTEILNDSKRFSVGLCHCRHVAHHLGRDCQVFEMECCLTIGPGVDYTVRHGLAREITKSEAFDLVSRTREANMVHLCDNVQRRPTFVCSCCGCCCDVLNGFRKFEVFGNTYSSNFEASVLADGCIGCKKCQKACPIDAIDLVVSPHMVNGKKIKKLAKVDLDVCLGCGVCALACESNALVMAPRAQRRLVPESAFARVLMMAIEQGKLQDLLFDKEDGFGATAASVLLGAITKLPPAKQLLARDAVKSRFVDFMLRRMR